MIADLRADSTRWRQEQRTTGTRGSYSPGGSVRSGFTAPDTEIESYVGSTTYHASSAATTISNRAGDSPHAPEYGMSGMRDRDRMPPGRIPDGMDLDQPMQNPRGYPQDRAYPPPPRNGFGPSNPGRAPGPFPGNDYPQEQAPYGRAPVTSPAYGVNQGYPPPPLSNGSNDGAPPGYVRQGNYYVPVSSYEQPGSGMSSRPEPPSQYGPGYGQPPPNQRNDLRGYGQPEYKNDPARFAYPSPATTVSSVAARERDPVTSAQQPRFAFKGRHRIELFADVDSVYGPPAGGSPYDQYGRPLTQHSTAGSTRQPEPFMQPARESREPSASFGRPAPPASTGGDQRRRRLA
nr:hypothetical protein CFP56_36421 [Quercus suber]